ncbi:MAG: LysR substrate-binding domain-containing protein [Acetobacteraceae bacterium]
MAGEPAGKVAAKECRAGGAAAGGIAGRLDLVTLRLFVTIVEEQSFIRAAERARIAPSALSKRISDLEHACGFALLARSHKGIEPTAAGRALLHHARLILRDVAQLESELAEFSQGTRGFVRIAANDSSIFGFLPEELRDFLDRHPNVHVEVQADLSPRIVQGIADGAADIGLFAGDVPTGELAVFPYHRDRLRVALPEGHKLAARDQVRFTDLLAYELIFPEEQSSIDTLLFRAAAAVGRSVKARIRVGSFEAVFRMVEMGIGLGIVPEQFAARVGPSMRIRTLPLAECWAVREHKLCVRSLDSLPVAARLLVERLVLAERAGEP